MILLGIDFETSGLSTDGSVVVELGAALYEFESDTYLQMVGYIISQKNVKWEDGAQHVSGITQAHMDSFGVSPRYGISTLNTMMSRCDYAVAHNGVDFDFTFYKNWNKSESLQPVDRLWIDTKTDLGIEGCARLVHLAADHGFVNPFPHRALFDVVTMLKVLKDYDINKVVEVAKSPKIIVEAIISKEDRDRCKKYYYRWCENGYQYKWTKKIREIHLAHEIEECRQRGFEIRVLPTIE